METTIDGILNRRAMVEQPATGFRIAIDTILLAAAVQARAEQQVLDLGCGVGGAMLALAVRVPGAIIHGLEIQEDLAALCRRNIARNRMKKKMAMTVGDARSLPGPLLFAFDHVMLNPPFHDSDSHSVSPDIGKSIANSTTMSELEMWVVSAARTLKMSGVMTMIHRADRLEEILGYMKPYFGATEVLPLLPKEGEAAKRVILRAHKGEGATATTCRPIILHRKNGGFTDELDLCLKQGAPLVFAREEAKPADEFDEFDELE